MIQSIFVRFIAVNVYCELAVWVLLLSSLLLILITIITVIIMLLHW